MTNTGKQAEHAFIWMKLQISLLFNIVGNIQDYVSTKLNKEYNIVPLFFLYILMQKCHIIKHLSALNIDIIVDKQDSTTLDGRFAHFSMHDLII